MFIYAVVLLSEGSIPIPGLLGIAILYALWKNFMIKKHLAGKPTEVKMTKQTYKQVTEKVYSKKSITLLQKWNLFLRSQKTKSFLEGKWWHRLIKVVLWIMLIYYYCVGAAFLYVEEFYKIGGYSELEFTRGFDTERVYYDGITVWDFILEAIYFIVWGCVMFLIAQFIYYKMILYIVYGKKLPK